MGIIMAYRGDPLLAIKWGAVILSILMFLGGGWLVYKRSSGMGPSTVQAFGIVLLLPTILVLAVTNSLSNEILATLLGGMVGYVFGRFGGDGR